MLKKPLHKGGLF